MATAPLIAGCGEDQQANTSTSSVVRLRINGEAREIAVDNRTSLLDMLRERAGLSGTKKGCDQGACGACTILVNGQRMVSCLTLAVMHDGAEITTVEGLTEPDGTLSPVQQAFADCHGLQCGFCTPGFLTTITAGLRANPDPELEQAREMVGGNLCRCTGYHNIVASVLRAAEIQREREAGTEDGRAAGDRREQEASQP